MWSLGRPRTHSGCTSQKSFLTHCVVRAECLCFSGMWLGYVATHTAWRSSSTVHPHCVSCSCIVCLFGAGFGLSRQTRGQQEPHGLILAAHLKTLCSHVAWSCRMFVLFGSVTGLCGHTHVPRKLVDSASIPIKPLFPILVAATSNLPPHMSHNCTARNFFLLADFRCSDWHVVSEILKPIGRTAGNIAAEWSGQSSFSLGDMEGCLLKLVKKTLPMFGSNAPDDCFRWLVAIIPALLPEGLGQWHGPTATPKTLP